jgi:hypothetical protein
MGLNRKMKRAKAKAQYEKFSRAWNDEKRFQKYMVEVQGAQVVDTNAKDESTGKYRQVIVNPDGGDMPVLGRRPTFQMWQAAMQNHTKAQQSIQEEKKVDVEDLSWEEDTVRQNSHSTSETDVSS